MKRLFRHTYTVRYDEADGYGLLTPAAFLRYMQDIAALDADDAALSGDGYWVVKRTLISFMAPVSIHTQLELVTSALGFTRVTAQREYVARIVGEDDAVISARTHWVYLDARGRPARLPEQTATIWLPDGPQKPQPEAPWSAFPSHIPDRATYAVRFSDTDNRRHMNNAAYVEALDDTAWDVYGRAGIVPDTTTITPLHYDIEYAESAQFGEQLEIQTWLDPFPSAGTAFTRFQQIKRGDAMLIRAHSRWLCVNP